MVGSILSLSHSATGRIFVCFAPKAKTSNLLAKELRSSTLAKADLNSVLSSVRNDRRASVSGSVIPNLNAVAHPIFSLQGNVILAATSLWPSERNDQSRDQSVEGLAQICREISSQLRYSLPKRRSTNLVVAARKK
jgi:DNA-binding IclR family transcriptional regulator